MAISYYNPNTTYNAPSFEEMMIPYKFVQERRDKYLQEMANTQDLATLINAMVPEGDPAKQIYEQFNNDLIKVRDEYMQTGYNANSLNNLLDLKHRYTKDIAPIEMATKKLAQLKAEDERLRSTNPTVIPNMDVNSLTVSGLINDPHLTVHHIEGNKISSLVSTMLQNMSKQLLDGNIPELLQTSPALQSIITQYGYTPEGLMRAMQNDSSFLNIMLGQVQTMLGIDGPEWQEAKPRILAAMGIGTTSTLGITDVRTQQDPIYMAALRAAQQGNSKEEEIKAGDHNINLIDMAFPNTTGLDVDDKPINLITDVKGNPISDNPNAPLEPNSAVGIGNFASTMRRLGFATDQELKDMEGIAGNTSLFSKDGRLLTPEIINQLKISDKQKKAMISAFNVMTKYIASMGHSFKDIDLESFRYLNSRGMNLLNRLQVKVMEIPFDPDVLLNIVKGQVDELRRPIYKVDGFANGQMKLSPSELNTEELTSKGTATRLFVSLMLPGKVLINRSDGTYAINVANENDTVYKDTIKAKNAYDALYTKLFSNIEFADMVLKAEEQWKADQGRTPTPLERIQLKEYLREKFLKEHPSGKLLVSTFNNTLKTITNNLNNTINSKYKTTSVATANTTKNNEIE